MYDFSTVGFNLAKWILTRGVFYFFHSSFNRHINTRDGIRKSHCVLCYYIRLWILLSYVRFEIFKDIVISNKTWFKSFHSLRIHLSVPYTVKWCNEICMSHELSCKSQKWKHKRKSKPSTLKLKNKHLMTSHFWWIPNHTLKYSMYSLRPR